MKTYVLYVPGLGDRYDGFRINALRIWKLWGVNAIHIPMIWYDGGSMESKLARVNAVIETVPEGAHIVLIGESAGATMALQAGQTNKRVDRIITLCGVARPDTPVSSYLRRRAPALSDGVDGMKSEIDTEVYSVRAFIDGVVAKRYSVVKGAQEHVIWSIGHLTTIALCLTVLSPYMARLAKKAR